MKRTLTALSVAATLTAGAALAQSADDATRAVSAVETAETAKPLELYGVRIGNPADPTTWWSGHEDLSADLEPMAINPMDPTFWIAFVDPKRHGQAHVTMMNPASMAQMMKIETYTNMMRLDTWAKWVSLDTYAPLLDLQTYAYWMQPGAYVHSLDLAQFEPMLGLDNYTIVFHTAFETAGVSEWVEASAALVGLHGE